MRRILCILLMFITFAVTAGEIKTYSGQYEDFIKKDALHPSGRATYTYYENEDGSRSYHGIFRLIHNKYSLSGKFKDNVQDGKWTYKEKNLYGTLTVNVNFVDGRPSGVFSVTLVKNSNGQNIGYVKAVFDNGILVGDISVYPHPLFYYSSYDPYMNKFSGCFDANGNPTGMWILKSKTRQLTEIYQNNGNEIRYVNTSTGDIINDNNLRIPYLPNIAVKIVNKLIPQIIFRDTPNFHIPRFELFIVPDEFEGSLNYFDGDGEYTMMRYNSYR